MFKDRLKMLREKNGMTQEELSKRIGVSKGAIGNYEQGSREPKSNETWKKIATLFNVSIDYLMDIDDQDCSNTTIPIEQNIISTFTSQEITLIQNYRKLSLSDQSSVLNIIEALIYKNTPQDAVSQTSTPQILHMDVPPNTLIAADTGVNEIDNKI